ncbi:MAG: hypothetical protein A2Z12_09370 [Actinobacteria bacterium RBG_16_68_21]|nr:MAG: hypothetical protein A2Z12_09370 [Actinobacteria bacterium RBG_16_68_21]
MPADRGDPSAERAAFDPVERQIREAMSRGEFDQLPGYGRPIENLDAVYDPAWWSKQWMDRSRLDDAVLEVRRTIHRELPLLKIERDHDMAERRAAEINGMIAAANERLPETERIVPIEL